MTLTARTPAPLLLPLSSGEELLERNPQAAGNYILLLLSATSRPSGRERRDPAHWSGGGRPGLLEYAVALACWLHC